RPRPDRVDGAVTPGLAAVFLDRDGTLNVKATEGEYVDDPAALVLLPGAAEAVRRLNDAGLTTVVVSNQRGVARALLDEADVDRLNLRLAELRAGAGAHLDAVFVGPHDHDSCECRKPRPGLIVRAVRELGIDPTAAVIVGDAESDVMAGRAAGLA